MRAEDLIPAFLSQLEHELKYGPRQDRATRKAHAALLRAIYGRLSHAYYETEDADEDVIALSDALEAYAAPYFYFGTHPGDGSDYGFWLSESWDEDFEQPEQLSPQGPSPEYPHPSIKVSDLSEVPKWFRGEVAVVNDHGNVSLYVKTARTLREVWGIV